VIKVFVSLLVRTLVELAVILLIASGLFFFVAYRTARRFATNTPDGIEKIAATLSTGLGLVAARTRLSGVPAEDDEDAAAVGREDWRDYVP
jgi:hypothetical protein